MASSFLPVLTDVEKASIRERQPLPDRYLGLSDEEMDRRIAAAKATLGTRLLILGHHYQRDEVIKFADITGDSLPVVAALRRAARSRVHRVLRCPLHGRERRRPVGAAPEGDPAGSRGGLFHVRHGRHRSARDVLGRARGPGHRRRGAGHLHQFRRGHQGLRRRAGRRRLHVVQLRGDAAVGVGARQAHPVPARPAPRTEHRVQDGRPARRHGGLGSGRGLGRPRAGPRARRAADPLEGPLLRAHPLHRGADRDAPGGASRASA